MDKYIKTINQLKKEYKNLKLSNTRNKTKSNKLINLTHDTIPVSTSLSQVKGGIGSWGGATSEPKQNTTVTNPADSNEDGEIKHDGIISSYVERFLKSEKKVDIDLPESEDLTPEKKNNISNFIKHGEYLPIDLRNGIFYPKQIDITNITIQNIMKYLDEADENLIHPNKFLKDTQNPKPKYEENFKNLIIKILNQQYLNQEYLNEQLDLEKHYKAANTLYLQSITPKGDPNNICKTEPMTEFMSLVKIK